MSDAALLARHEITRVRRETRRRSLAVAKVETLTPRMRRIVLASPELNDFDSGAHDDHVKLFFPDAPLEKGKPANRDFTPRAFDRAAGTLTIDFALHEAGPATAWASRAQVGDTLEIGGPRGSMVVPDDFDWYLMVGDETALPAITRRVEELRAGVPVTTVVTVDDAQEAQHVETAAAWSPFWVYRRHIATDDAEALRAALAAIDLPRGDGFVWIAAEASVARALRDYLVLDRGCRREWVKAAGYWKRGAVAAHERIDD